ncbi:ATP-binding protein [Paenibacillus sp. FSL H7-0331]|uniref:ATP-binding protein n=1 Tax=Paenibacillus sp. FSL H7-0331 TaxID=1920421 RepID=UPI00096ED1B3|nr:ATP-binding protein [Paenibacillus sp. FSL H7-0331]OMF20511.1 ArsR family transcriptional regulator [Paenibacillus sp. FSL H7-0331]
MTRDLGLEMDELKKQLNELQRYVQQSRMDTSRKSEIISDPADPVDEANGGSGRIYYSGQYRNSTIKYKWEAQEQQISSLLNQDGEKLAKILSALGNKQRLDILRSVLQGPVNGTDLVERLHMGTTGQLYHHTKALMGADLLIQEERGGEYSLPAHRVLPVLLLLAAAADLADTGNYMDMAEARDHAGLYLGAGKTKYDPHLLVWALIENSILEHQSGYCSQIDIYLHDQRNVTVADNGRGIPISALSAPDKPNLLAVLTDIQRPGLSAPYFAAGGEKGISVAVVNALSYQLAVEIRRDGHVYRQNYKHGIPQTGVRIVGATGETGTSVTVETDPDLFAADFELHILEKRAAEIQVAYPKLTVLVH